MLHMSNEFNLVIESIADGTQPNLNMGTTITPGNNTYGSYASIIAGASVTDDAYMIEICFNSNDVDGAARDTIVTIGFDPAGGTSFGGLGGVASNEINHLLASSAGAMRHTSRGPVWYRFPLYIKSGTSIGAKASVNNGTVGTLLAFVRLYCKPSRPELVRAGSFVRTFGEVTATSKGTDITAGTASEGAYVQLGSALVEPLWYWEYGIGANTSTFQSNAQVVDIALGDATNKKRVIANHYSAATSNEVMSKDAAGTYGTGAVGDLVYGRMQVGENASAGSYSLCAYGVGG